MREFKLINARGDTWNMNELDSFLHSPKGLGGERKQTYIQVGNRFKVTKDVLKQKAPTCKVAFSGYEEFNRFAKFIQHKPLVLEYTTPAGTYYMQVYITKVTKTELETVGLQTELTFAGLTTWYKKISLEKPKQPANSKKYPYSYNYVYTDTERGTLKWTCESTEDSPIRLSILGPCKNPMWVHRVDGQVVASGKLQVDIEAGHRVVIDTTQTPFCIAEYTNRNVFVRDLYGFSDFETERFLFAGFGENRITVIHEGIGDMQVAMEVQEEYAVV